MTERKTRFSMIDKLERKEAAEVKTVIIRRLSREPQPMRQTITYDNGSENVQHGRINDRIGSRSYFCDTYCSWQKGTVENTIGIVRRFLPKKTDFAMVTNREIKNIENWLNNRPRKCLNFKTPSEAYNLERCT